MVWPAYMLCFLILHRGQQLHFLLNTNRGIPNPASCFVGHNSLHAEAQEQILQILALAPASTSSVAWFVLLHIANPYETEIKIATDSTAIFIIVWLQFRNYRTPPAW